MGISIKIQIIIVVVMFFALIMLTDMVRRKKLELKYYLPWLFMIVALLIVTVFPDLLEIVAGFLGITLPINMIFFCGFIFSLIIIITLTVALSRMSNRIRSLAQKIALVEHSQEK